MPHISSKKLDEKLLENLFGKLIIVFEQAQSKKYLKEVLRELFTETEKVMFAKRIAIVLMLTSSTPQHKIVDILGVSPTTVAKMSLEIEIGKYKTILKISKEERVGLEKIVWAILTAGGIMPPKAGKRN